MRRKVRTSDSGQKAYLRGSLVGGDVSIAIEFGRRIEDGVAVAYFEIDGAQIDVSTEQLERLNDAAKRVFEQPFRVQQMLRPRWLDDPNNW